MLDGHFPETTGLRFIGELYKTLGHSIEKQDRKESLSPDARDTLARARALRDIFGRSIRHSWFCMQAIGQPDLVPKNPKTVNSMPSVMANTPETMYMNGLYLLLALNAPIDQTMFREMAHRYYQAPTPLVPRPDVTEQTPLLYPATRGMARLKEIRAEAEQYQINPEAFPEFSANFAQRLTEIFAATFAIQHYLAMSADGSRQFQGLRQLDEELAALQKVTKHFGISETRTVDKVLGEIRATLPIQETEAGLYNKVSQAILQQSTQAPTEPKNADSRAAQQEKKRQVDNSPLPRPHRKPRGP